MNSTSILTMLLLVASAPAFAYPEQPSPQAGPSPALQMARRVAAIENDRDLPSRAVWLGKKVAFNTRLAGATKPTRKYKKKQAN